VVLTLGVYESRVRGFVVCQSEHLGVRASMVLVPCPPHAGSWRSRSPEQSGPLPDAPGPLHLHTRGLRPLVPTRWSRSMVGVEPEVDGKGDSSEGNEHAQGARGGMPDDDRADARSEQEASGEGE
jgi:hypothetical protein